MEGFLADRDAAKILLMKARHAAQPDAGVKIDPATVDALLVELRLLDSGTSKRTSIDPNSVATGTEQAVSRYCALGERSSQPCTVP